MTTSRRSRRRLYSTRRLAGPGLALFLLGACAAEEIEPEPRSLAVASLATPDLGFYKGFYLPLDNEVMYETEDVKVVANGNLALSFADAQFEGAANEDEELEDYRASINLRGALTVELSVEGSGAISGEVELLTVPLGAFAIGPNVEVIPYATVRLLASGTAEADARVSLIAPFSAGSRVSSPGSDGSFSSEPTFEPEIGMPELIGNFTGTIDVDVTMSFMTTVFGLPVGGPFIGTRFGAELEIDTTTSTWDLDARGLLTGGWASPDLAGLPELPEEPPLRRNLGEWDIAGGAIPDFSTSWSQVYDIDNDDQTGVALRSGDGLILAESGHRPWLGSLDGDGVPGWQGTRAELMQPRAMAYSSNGDVLVAGERSGTTVIVERYTAAGERVWRNTATVPGANFAKWNAILPTITDGAILAGEVSYTGFQRTLFAEIDVAGNLVWQTEIDAGAGSSNPMIKAMAWTPSGEILAVGQVRYPAPDTTQSNYGLVLRLDASGNPRAAFAVGSGSQFGSLLAAHPDGSYTIAGNDGLAPHDVWIASMRDDDTLSWSASYQSRPNVVGNSAVALPTGLAAVGNHGLLVSGHIGSPYQDAFVLRIDRAGMPMFVKSYISADDDELSGIVAMPGGFAAFGSTGFTETNGSYSDVWVIRPKVDGMIHFTEGNGFETTNTAAQWQRNEGHAVHVLAPAQVATTLAGPPAEFTFTPAAAVGELLTD